MRLAGYILLFFSLCPIAKAQPASFHLESGIAMGEPFYQCEYGASASAPNGALSVKIGATLPINQTFQLNSGIRYNILSCTTTLVALYNDQAGILGGTQQTKQHLLTIPLHLQTAGGRVYFLFGPDIVLLAHAQQITNWQEWTEHQSASGNRSGAFARLNMKLSAGGGVNFRLHTQPVYLQLIFSRVAFGHNQTERPFVSGYRQELYLSMGIRL